MQHHATCGLSLFAWTSDKCIHDKLELQYLRGCLFRMSTSDVVLAKQNLELVLLCQCFAAPWCSLQAQLLQ